MLHMSAMLLVPHHCLNGLAEAFFAIGQSKSFYSQFPKCMSSIMTSLFGLEMVVANLLVGAIVGIVDDTRKRGGKKSWVYGPCAEEEIMVKDEDLKGRKVAKLVPNLKELQVIPSA
ncbi:hypothetical protein Syun_012141 [Stephania yunnanensis]|uniref:Uncharacterized protein n=1 Tax=Stephania yunnanensis TaxID=152371 RepID=A0AAP0JZ37_9MAGN